MASVLELVKPMTGCPAGVQVFLSAKILQQPGLINPVPVFFKANPAKINIYALEQVNITRIKGPARKFQVITNIAIDLEFETLSNQSPGRLQTCPSIWSTRKWTLPLRST